MADVTCWTLIECAADGDRAARDAFVERYLPVVRAYMRARWGNRVPESELEDTVQEVFVECLREEGVLVRNRSRRGQTRRKLFAINECQRTRNCVEPIS